MVVGWLIAVAALALAAAAIPKWRAWSPLRRRLHIGLSAVASVSLGIMAHVMLGELVDAGQPILTSNYPWMVAIVALLLAAIVLVVSALPWRGHLPWAILAPPMFLALLSAPYEGAAYTVGISGLDVILQIVLLVWLAMMPWAFPAAVARWQRWDGKAQTVVAGLFVLYAALPIATEGVFSPYGPEPATHTVTISVESDGAYEMSIRGLLGGPWDPFMGRLASHDATQGDIRLDGRALSISGSGHGTLTLVLEFYGSTGDQEWHQQGDLQIQHEGALVILTVTMDNVAPSCRFVSTWEGVVEQDRTLVAGDGYGECE